MIAHTSWSGVERITISPYDKPNFLLDYSLGVDVLVIRMNSYIFDGKEMKYYISKIIYII